jgi:hypothetical protein
MLIYNILMTFNLLINLGFLRLNIVYFQWRDKMKNGMYINRKKELMIDKERHIDLHD